MRKADTLRAIRRMEQLVADGTPACQASRQAAHEAGVDADAFQKFVDWLEEPLDAELAHSVIVAGAAA